MDTCTHIQDLFVAGWAREASTGLVGVARRDGINGATATLRYLESLPGVNGDGAREALAQRMHLAGVTLIGKPDLERLEAIEREQAARLGVDDFKFASNKEMLAVLEKV